MHCQAITTKFHGPTNNRGARIAARAAAGCIFTHWDYSLNQSANHAAAAKALAEKLAWNGVWVSGGLPDGNGDVFVLCASGIDGDAAELNGFSAAFCVESSHV